MHSRNARDFMELEFMTNSELREAIEYAEQDLMDLQDYLSMIDEEAEHKPGFTKYAPIEPIMYKMNNLEGYIRKAENLISRFENKRYLARADRVKDSEFYSPFKKEFIQTKLGTLKRITKAYREPLNTLQTVDLLATPPSRRRRS